MDRKITTDKAGLLDLLHDQYFDLEQLEFDRESHEVRLSFGNGYKSKGPYDQKLLKVTDVSDVSIRDRARIQIYTLNTIEFTDASVSIELEPNLEIVLTIGKECRVGVETLIPVAHRAIDNDEDPPRGSISNVLRFLGLRR